MWARTSSMADSWSSLLASTSLGRNSRKARTTLRRKTTFLWSRSTKRTAGKCEKKLESIPMCPRLRRLSTRRTTVWSWRATEDTSNTSTASISSQWTNGTTIWRQLAQKSSNWKQLPTKTKRKRMRSSKAGSHKSSKRSSLAMGVKLTNK